MTFATIRLPLSALLLSLVLTFLGAGPARGQNIIAQYAFGGDTGEVSSGKDLSGRSGIGWEATATDPNATAQDALLSDSIPPSHEDYIEITSPSYVDANGNQFPVLRFEPGNNSRSPDEAVTKDKYFSFTVSANAGFTLNLANLTFNVARGGGAMPRGWVLLSSVDGFANPIDSQEVLTQRPNLSTFTVDLSGPQFQGLTTVTFRMYVYVPGGGQSLEFNNVTLNGTVQ